jgi:hypothetical protein
VARHVCGRRNTGAARRIHSLWRHRTQSLAN